MLVRDKTIKWGKQMGVRQVIDCDGCLNKDIQIGSYLGFHVGFIYGGPETEKDYSELYLCSFCTQKLSSEIGEKIMEIKLIPYVACQTVCKGKGFEETRRIVRLIKEGKVQKSIKIDPILKKNLRLEKKIIE